MARRHSTADRPVSNFIGLFGKRKELPPFGSRSKTDAATLAAKAKVLQKYRGLAIESSERGNRAKQITIHGANSIRAEIIDLNSMVVVMEDNITVLTHTAVERFFQWFEPFVSYLERYMLVEEDFLIKIIESKCDMLKGGLKPSARMVMRGKMQRHLHDLVALQDIFTPYLPAGQKLPQVIEACDLLTKQVVEFWSLMTTELPPLIKQHFTKSEMDKLRTKLVKHVVNHIGYKDFIAMFTRWMGPADLLEWKTHVLLPCDYKFFSYANWDREMQDTHYYIPSRFREFLLRENEESTQMNEESKADFERARETRMKMAEEDGSSADFEDGEGELYYDDTDNDSDVQIPASVNLPNNSAVPM